MATTTPTFALSTNGAPTKWFGIAGMRDGGGYWVVSNTGTVEAFGDADPHGDLSSTVLNQPVVGIAPTPDGKGYWLDAADGGIFSFGDAAFWGSTGSLHLNKPVVGMAPTQDGRGYWMVASDGGVFAFGDAAFEGSLGGQHINKPVVGIAPTQDGRGYWMVASDGGVFAFGDAAFEGSLGADPPTSPIVYMAPTPDNNGYWLVSADGSVYTFGDAPYYGGVTSSTSPATSLAAPPSGGYWILTADGDIHPFGDARSYGSPVATPVTPTGPATGQSTPPPSDSGVSSATNAGSTGSAIEVSPGGLTATSTAHLTLNGEPYQAIGVNAYEIASDYGVNAGCGPMETTAQLDQLFSSLPPHSLVRFSAFQGALATNVTTHQLDWGPIDRVFQAAATYNQLLIPVITGQGAYCDGQHWQDPSWYAGGFTQVFNTTVTSDGQGLTPLSYWDYLQAIVNRYKNSPALGMWEPVSEADPETCPVQNVGQNCTCPSETAAMTALRHFFDVVGAEIHSLDPTHLVESGLEGGGQCGTAGTDYQYVSASPGIDVMSFHDYYGAQDPLGGPPANDVATRLAQAAALGKPIIGGEIGLEAGTGPTCMTDAERAAAVSTVTQTVDSAGADGLLWWDWVPSLTQPCNWDIAPGDPLLSTLNSLAQSP